MGVLDILVEVLRAPGDQGPPGRGKGAGTAVREVEHGEVSGPPRVPDISEKSRK